MRRRLVVWFAVVATVLVVTAAPASAASVVSINTTAADFNAATTLDNLEVDGSGAAANVTGDVGAASIFTESLSDSGSDGTAESGIVFTVSKSHSSLVAEQTGAAGGSWDLILRYDSNGTQIAKKSSVAGTAGRLNATLSPGVDYRLTIKRDDNGLYSLFQGGVTPQSSGTIDVIGGRRSGSADTDIWNIERLEVGAPEKAEYVGQEHMAEAETLFANITELNGANATITAQENTGSGWSDVTSTTVTTTGNKTLDISTSSADRYRAKITFQNTTGLNSSVTLSDEGVEFTASAPVASNPDPADGADLTTFDDTVSIQVNDSDFAKPQGDSVLATARDGAGNIVGQQSLSSNGTAEVSYSAQAGTNYVNWTLTDDYGQTDQLNTSWTAPETITIREVGTGDVVKPVQVNGTFFGSDEVFSETSTDGNISVGGLPADEEFVLEIQANGYYTRRVIIEDLFAQQTAYIINKSNPPGTAVNLTFEVNDQTGNYPSSETQLIVQRPINESGTTKFRAVAGDYLTAADQFPTTLIEDDRYRIVVESDDGDRRELGTFIPQASQEGRIVSLTITGGSVGVQEGETYAWDARFTNQSGVATDPKITFEFDANETVDDLRVIVYERGDASNEIYNATSTGITSDTRQILLTDAQGQKTWVVNWTADLDGDQIGGERIVGDDRFEIGVPLDDEWKHRFAIIGLLVFGGLFGGVRSDLGGMAVATGGGLLLLMGWLPPAIGGLAIAGGFAVGVISHAGRVR